MELAAGTTYDRYEVLELLGEGGMAVVYKVRHSRLGSIHALKVLSTPASSIRERLLQEGRSQAAIHHPNVLPVSDVIDVNGAPGLIMEFVAGPNLEALLDRHRPEAAEAEALAMGILMCKDTPDQLKHAIDTGEFPTQNNAIEEVLRSDAPGLVNSIMPYKRGTAGELLVEKAVKDGNKMARDGQLQDAVTFWLGVINVDPYNASAAYNIGLAFEAVDDLDSAKTWYGKAGALQAKDEITQSLTRVSGRSGQVAVLTQKYGMTHTPGVLSAVAPDPAAAAVQTVTVSGGKNARIPLRDAGSDGAGVVVQLPGGMMVTVVEVQDDWVKVRTADGKEGFLMGKEVDGLKK